MLMSEGKIAPANLVYAGHFSGMRVFQDVGAIPVLISASGKDSPNPQELFFSVLQTS
jgi:hypothetical protein